MNSIPETTLAIGQRLHESVLSPLKSAFVGKDEVVDLLGISLVAGENLFILGPPGTAKSAIVHQLSRKIEGRTFEYLLTRFTEPSELFGPFDIRKLKEGTLETNTEGMLPEASLVFLDELLNANSAILNSVLTVLNERKFRRGRESRDLDLLMVVGASNQLPQDDALRALFDRFLLRTMSDNVADDELGAVLKAGWKLDDTHTGGDAENDHQSDSQNIGIEEIRQLHRAIAQVDLSGTTDLLCDLVTRIRRAGITVSDRRAVKLQRPIAASALLCGRGRSTAQDLWILRHIWDRTEQREVLIGIVDGMIKEHTEQSDSEKSVETHHPQATADTAPDPEQLAAALDDLKPTPAGDSEADGEHRAKLCDQLATIAERVQWVRDEVPRTALQKRVDALWIELREEANDPS